jgi:hypothetical protein
LPHRRATTEIDRRFFCFRAPRYERQKNFADFGFRLHTPFSAKPGLQQQLQPTINKKGKIMKKLQHTPGPWTYQYSPWHSDHAGEIPAFEIFGEEKICDTNEDRPREEQEANACLIAAAPELLEALEQQTDAAQAVIDSWERGDLAGAVCGLDACIEASRAAIAEATGGA